MSIEIRRDLSLSAAYSELLMNYPAIAIMYRSSQVASPIMRYTLCEINS